MKKQLLPFLFILTILHAKAQGNPDKIGESKIPVPVIESGFPETVDSLHKSAAGIPCSTGVFWAIRGGGNGSVDELSLSGSTISYGGTILNLSVDGNLAYCNNLDGWAFSPTFYSTYQSRQPRYYDGNAWVTSGVSAAPDKIFNCGGRGNDLYYLLYDSLSVSKGIAKYNGSSLTTFWSWPNTRKASVADLAVDDNGNLWFFTGPAGSGSVISDSLFVVSPTGQLLNQFAMNVNTSNAYGLLLLNSTIYIALGASHPTSPNSLLPVLISGTSVATGIPIPMPLPAVVYADMESCNPGTPSGLLEIGKTQPLSLFPNPVSTSLTVFIPDLSSGEAILNIQNAAGQTIMEMQKTMHEKNGVWEINCGHLTPGNYSVSLRSGSKSYHAKFVKVE